MAANEFSASGETAIHKSVQIPVTDSDLSDSTLACEYSLTQCLGWISERNFRYIAIQVADTHATLAVPLQDLLSGAFPDRDFVVLADGTDSLYCCADENSALHFDAIDAILVFGDSSCFSTTRKLPVCYVVRNNRNHFVDMVNRTEEVLKRDKSSDVSRCLLLAEPQYYHAAKCIYEDYYRNDKKAAGKLLRMQLRSNSPNVCIIHDNELISFENEHAGGGDGGAWALHLPYNIGITSPNAANDASALLRTIARVVFIGDKNSAACFNFQLAFQSVPEFIAVDPVDFVRTAASRSVFYMPHNLSGSSDLLRIKMRRQFLVEKLKAARIVGVLVTSTSMQTAQPLIEHIQALIANSGRFSAIFYVGKGLRGEKLANFAEVDCFVNICCANVAVQLFSPTGTSNAKKFFQPVVSPYDAELAYNLQREGDPVVIDTDFTRLLPTGDLYKPKNSAEALERENGYAEVSLLSGRSNALVGGMTTEKMCEDGLQIIPRNEALVVDKHTTNAFINSIFANRSWTGLDATPGVVVDSETGAKITLENSKNFARLEQGRSGIAHSYADEPTAQ